MSEFWYVYSNGRCGTQFLARQLSLVARDERVVHEVFPVDMAARRVFRNPQAIYDHLGRTVKLQRYFIMIENTLARGKSFIYCGWPAYAWLEYLAERFGDAFRYVHLVRNPYDNAASHCTHMPLRTGRLNPLERSCRVFGTDPFVKYTQFAAICEGFNTFERHLLHWLEITSYALEHADLPAFRGLIRFEDLVAAGDTALNALMSEILGRPVQSPDAAPFDRVHCQMPWAPDFQVHPQLRAEVDALALRLGYSQATLDQARDPDRLTQIYSGKRFDLPCDPALPVIPKP